MICRWWAIAASLTAAALAQAPGFEAASIKLSGPNSIRGSEGGPGSSDPGQYRFGRVTLQDLIAQAYQVSYERISSTVSLDEQRFDLVAKLPAGTTKEEFRRMIQALLAERFHLKAHTISKDFPAFEMVVANGGARLKIAAAAENGQPSLSSRFSTEGGFTVVHVTARRASMALLANMLPRPGDPPVIDKTGLTGTYDFTLDYTIERDLTDGGAPASAPSAPDLPVALRQQLGLQLVSKKMPFPVVVVDSVDKLPTQN